MLKRHGAQVLRLSVLWLAVAAGVAPFMWGFLSALAGAATFGGSSPALLSNATGAALWAVAAIPLWLPPYAVALLAWPRVVDRFPGVERTGVALAFTAAALALPLALLVAASYAGRVPFVAAFSTSLITAWSCLILPRLAIRVLRPGAFLGAT